MKIYKFIMVVGLMTYCLFLTAQDKYFYEQYALDLGQNGLDIVLNSDNETIICGDKFSGETLKWDPYVLILDEYGNTIKDSTYTETDIETSYRVIIPEEKGYTVFADVFYPANSIVDNTIKMLKINENLEIDTSIVYNDNTNVECVIKIGDDYVMAGFNNVLGSLWNPYLIMVNSEGDIIWELILEGFTQINALRGIVWDEQSQLLYCSGSVQISSADFTADPYFLVVDLEGQIITESIINVDPNQDFGGDIIHLNESFYIRSNKRLPTLANKGRMIKYSSTGEVIFTTEGIPHDGSFTDIALGLNDYIYISGSVLIGNDWQASLVKYDTLGNLIWWKDYGLDGSDYGYNLTIDKDGSILLTGRTESNTVGADILLVKTNCMGLFTEPEANYNFTIEGNQVSFENLSEFVYPEEIDGGHYIWDFGDGNISSSINNTHEYAVSGAYEVTLTAVVCQDTSVYSTCIYLEENTICCRDIEESPIAAFSVLLIDSLSVSLENQSANLYQEYNNGTQILWDFGDGTFSTEFSPDHTFAEANYYDITLSLILCGDTISLSETVKVGEPVGIEMVNNNAVSVYPNPATTSLTFEYDIEQKETLFIYNSLGQLIQEVELSPVSKSETIVTDGFVEGVYYWQLGQLSGKLLIKR